MTTFEIITILSNIFLLLTFLIAILSRSSSLNVRFAGIVFGIIALLNLTFIASTLGLI